MKQRLWTLRPIVTLKIAFHVYCLVPMAHFVSYKTNKNAFTSSRAAISTLYAIWYPSREIFPCLTTTEQRPQSETPIKCHHKRGFSYPSSIHIHRISACPLYPFLYYLWAANTSESDRISIFREIHFFSHYRQCRLLRCFLRRYLIGIYDVIRDHHKNSFIFSLECLDHLK